MAGLFAADAVVDVVGYAQVALEQGIDATSLGLTYAIPASMRAVRVGDRVVVPLGRGNKPTHGYVTAIDAQLPGDVPMHKVKAIRALDAAGLSLPLDLIELARWMASYYICPLGMVFASMLPAAVKRGTGTMRETLIEAAQTQQGEQPKLTKLQKAVMEAVAAHPEPLEIHHLAHVVGAKTITPIRLLVKQGLLRARQHSVVRADWDELVEQAAAQRPQITLSASQQAALDHLFAKVTSGFGVHLLHGVTGSGKTEVYLRLIEHVLGEGGGDGDGVSGMGHGKRGGDTASSADTRDPRSDTPAPGALMLVPEIALTPQTAARFIERFGAERVAVLHSALTAAQRHEEWRRIRGGQARIIVGARSAIFAPVDRAAVIIVDEEHEPSYKQDQLPRYHARDVAIRRAQALGIPIVLGSATPSLESYANATGIGCGGSGIGPSSALAASPRPHWHLLQLPERVAGLKLPVVELVDLSDERRKRYEMTGRGGIHLLSLRLEKVMQQTLAAQGQVMLLLNRRGYANYISCPDHRCGWLKTCDYCDATMVYHKDQRLPEGGVVKCHHCEAEQLLPKLCPVCGRKVTTFGLGTQRVEEEIAAKFPGVSSLRMDSDTMRTGRDYHSSLEAFRRGEVKILLGTQMIAKGLDFPNVRVVGVISADTALNLPDFRASERTFQLIAQVAGRAGRGEHPGRVIVQTYSPQDPAIVLAAKHDYETFAARELAIRAEVGLPPASRMARIVVRHRDHAAGLKLATELADLLQQANASAGSPVRLRGPMPPPIARIAEFHRHQIELIAPPPEAAVKLQKLLTTLRNQRRLISDMHTAIDVDPVALL
jgi:primosomal protein N' (replication factor Y)